MLSEIATIVQVSLRTAIRLQTKENIVESGRFKMDFNKLTREMFELVRIK